MKTVFVVAFTDGRYLRICTTEILAERELIAYLLLNEHMDQSDFDIFEEQLIT